MLCICCASGSGKTHAIRHAITRTREPNLSLCAGEHEHTIIGYSLVKGIGDGEPIASERFTVGGHEWVLLFYPDGKRSSSSEAGLGGGVGAVIGPPPGAGNGFEGGADFLPCPCATVLKAKLVTCGYPLLLMATM